MEENLKHTHRHGRNPKQTRRHGRNQKKTHTLKRPKRNRRTWKKVQIHGKNFQVADSLSACKPFKAEFGNCKLANLKRCLVKVRVRVNWKW